MRDIKEMAFVLSSKLDEKLKKLEQAQKDTANQIWEDTIADAPLNAGEYISSIKVSDTEFKNDVLTTSVYSDLLVFWKKKNINVPLAAFLEWGIGPLGEVSNTFPHGYSYTTDAPWDYATQMQFELTGTWGREARPHFYPSLQKNVALYKENIRKALKEE